MRKILIIGATAKLGHETAKHFAADGDAFFLFARNSEKLKIVAQDLKTRGASQAECGVGDVDDVSQHESLIAKAEKTLEGLDIVFIAHGVLGDQSACEKSYEETRKVLQTNFLSVVSLLTLTANFFEKQKKGSIAVISSVAGDRGRQGTYVYCASKSAVDTFMQGLRNRLYKSNVSVTTIKPGVVMTPMTAHLGKKSLFASPEPVGRSIYLAIVKKKDILYVPWFWQLIMFIVRLIPESIFKRLSLKA